VHREQQPANRIIGNKMIAIPGRGFSILPSHKLAHFVPFFFSRYLTMAF
jgi:hypothetical protein